ncbi:HPP family protein [Pseudochelatococcus contaminans]|uniref:CBS-domain-containing membrane protein n=1 Tax=Pseudochelatococcus contaminans TaxID=1538103 RepID=A0A7W6EEU6_9HYPH|nr:HPP family protein [Pseudochelatococcus contaminans]MBB3807952.1 CBS-domain-containing membrane protein [Pseudochelatococcus contaminans]
MRGRRHLIDMLIRLRAFPVVQRAQMGMLVGGFSFLIIYGLSTSSQYAHVAMIMASLGASCVLVFTLPQSPLAQPSNVIFGHILSTGCGLLSLQFFGQTPLAFGIGVGLAIFVMAVTGTLHPPGAGNPILVIGGNQGLWYLLTPTASGAIVVVLAGLFYHRFISGHIYPVRKV